MSSYPFRGGKENRRRMLRLFTAATKFGLVLGTVIMTMPAPADSSIMTASPISGTGPLEVTFIGKGSGVREGVMLLDFGDGQTDLSISTIRTFKRTHTYAVPGTYIAELKSGAYGGQRPSVLTTVATLTITVH